MPWPSSPMGMPRTMPADRSTRRARPAISSVAIKKWGQRTHPVPFNAAAVLYGALIMGTVAAVVERDQKVVFEKWP